MRIIITLIISLVLIIPQFAFAGTSGTLEGKVTDTDGKPLKGAKIFVDGPARTGTIVKKPDGSYVIGNLEAGVYEVTASFLGKGKITKEIRISADLTSTLNFELGDKSVTTDAVVVTAVGAKKVNKFKVGEEKVLTQADRDLIPSNSILGNVVISAGVQAGGGGLQIRGSRANQTLEKVDGMDLSSAFSGSTGRLGAGNYPAPSPDATEEISIKSGGQGAEYGGMLGGVVNSSLKTGSTKRFEGFFNYATDAPSLYGSQKTGLEFEENEGIYSPVETGEGLKLLGNNLNQFEFGFGGPLGFLNSTFYLSGNNVFIQNRSAGYDIKDPAGNSVTTFDNNGSWRKNITGRVRLNLSDNINVVLGGMWGMTNLEQASWGWLYSNRVASFQTRNEFGEFIETGRNNIPERVAKQNVANQDILNVYAKIVHAINKTTSYELSVKYSENNDFSARRKGMEDPSYFGGFDIVDIVDNVFIDNNTLEVIQDTFDLINDYYQQYFNPAGRSLDSSRVMSIPLNNPFSGYIEGFRDFTTENPYGIDNRFIGNGGSGYEFRDGSYVQVDGNFEKIFDLGKFNHKLKAGFEYRTYNAQRHLQGSPSNSTPSSTDVYSEKYPNIYVTDPELLELSKQAKTPWAFNFFVHDQIRFQGLVFTPGLRVDYFEPNSLYRLPSDRGVFTPIRLYKDPSFFGQASAKIMVAPRINVTYPVSDKANISLNYGVFYKMPDLNPIFDYYNLDETGLFGGSVGDPNIDPERANSYQISYEQELTDILYFKASAYYKDIYNELGIIAVNTTPNPYYLTAVTEYGYNRGIEFNLSKARSENYTFDLNYAISAIKGTADGTNTNLGLAPDRTLLDTVVYPYPQDVYPLNRDITHKVNLTLAYFLGKEEGMSIGGIYPFENTFISTQTLFQTGSPYTPVDFSGLSVGERNSLRQPNFWSTTAKISKTFYLSNMLEWFNDKTTLEVYAFVNNIFNLRGPVGFFTTTGSPIDNYQIFRRRITNISPEPYYKEYNVAIPESNSFIQFDLNGKRKYNANADLDGNGLVTQEERYKQDMKYLNDTQRSKGNFQRPITFSFGLKLRF